MELDFWMNKIYKTEHRVEEVCCSKCFIVFFISFLVYFDTKVHKKLKKKIKQANKIQTLDFAESNAHRKTNARGSFETYDLFFLALDSNLFYLPDCVHHFKSYICRKPH